jgi:hypothetical protein
MSVDSGQDFLGIADSLAGLFQAQRRRFLGDLQQFISTEKNPYQLITLTSWCIVGAHQAHNGLRLIHAKRYVPAQFFDAFSRHLLAKVLDDPGASSHRQGVSRLYFSRYYNSDQNTDDLFFHDLSCSTSAGDFAWLVYTTRISAPLTYEIMLLAAHVFGDKDAVKAMQNAIVDHCESQWSRLSAEEQLRMSGLFDPYLDRNLPGS